MTRIGVDLHKNFAAVSLVDEGTGEVRERGRMPVRAEIEPWQELVEGVSFPVRILVESTQGCFPFAEWMEEQKIGEVQVAQADSLPAARNRGRKTDYRDAQLLRDALASPSGYRTCHRPSRQQRLDQAQVSGHRLVVEGCTRLMNWLHAALAEWGMPVKRGNMTLDRAEEALGKLEAPLRSILEPVVAAWKGLMEQRKAQEKAIRREARRRPEVRRLMSSPGVKEIIALNVVAYLGDPDRFSDGGQVGAFLGLVPWVSQSGDRTHRGRITKIGCAPLRHMLVLAAKAASRMAGSLREFYLRVKRKKNGFVARTALARKMGVILWAMWRDGREYSPTG